MTTEPDLSDLRSRKRVRTMRQIQRVAVDLFDERGYESVTIADIAAAAEVGERSVYRYFGSKQRVLLYDELDDFVIAALADNLRRGPLLEAVHRSLDDAAELFTSQVMTDAVRKLRVLDSTPELRTAVAGYTVVLGDQIGRAIATRRPHLEADGSAQIAGRCIVAALAVAVDRWFVAGGGGSLLDDLHRAVDLLGRGLDDGS